MAIKQEDYLAAMNEQVERLKRIESRMDKHYAEMERRAKNCDNHLSIIKLILVVVALIVLIREAWAFYAVAVTV